MTSLAPSALAHRLMIRFSCFVAGPPRDLCLAPSALGAYPLTIRLVSGSALILSSRPEA